MLSLVGAVVLALVLLAPSAEAARKKRPVRGGYSPPYASFVYDVNNGRVLQETNADALRHPASITKVMTLYMLFEQLERGRLKLNSELPVSAFAARQAPSKLSLKAGETIEVEDAIKALVTKSANDVAVVIAEAIGGSEARFAEMMTQKARAIGMSRSTFKNASGLPNPAQITTARDLATLGQAIQDRFPKYYAYFGTRSFTYDGADYRNHNRLLGAVEGVDGIKTGYTNASGFNLLTSAKSDGRHIIAVVLGGRSARARDQVVAALVQKNLPIAYAGTRTTAKVIEVAKAKSDVKVAPAQTATASAMPDRPRPAVIAEGQKPAAADATLSKNRPVAAARTPKSAPNPSTTALALVAQPSRPPVMRWVETAPSQNQSLANNQTNAGSRINPPQNVRYTNSTTPNSPVVADKEQILPESSEPNIPPLVGLPKNEQRLPSPTTTTSAASVTSAPNAGSVNENQPPSQPPQKAEKAKQTPVSTPTRSGWVIQLAAAESESKARTILDSAIAKNNSLLKEADPFTEAVTKGDSTFYRARFAGFDAEEAQSACKSLKRSGFNCFAQKL